MTLQTRREWLQTTVASLAGLALPACGRTRSTDDFDVCIVGSGPAGAILAAELVQHNVRTLLLEGGPIQASRSAPLGNLDGNPISRAASTPYPVDETRFFGKGGTSNLWDARCPRLQPFDFSAKNPYVPADAPWPITYDDIEPYYQKAERELSIGGAESTRYSPPRRAGFPFPPVDASPPTCLLELMRRYGWSAEVVPQSRAPRVAETHLPRISSSPFGKLVPNAKVVSIATDPGGRVAGLTARMPDGAAQAFRARLYVLACGGTETPRLLLLSRTSEFPMGIGNESEQVGRHFMEHLALEVGTINVPSTSACTSQEYEGAICWQVYDEFKSLGLGGVILEFGLAPSDSKLNIRAVLEMKPSATNRVVLSEKDSDALGAPLAEVIVTVSDDERRTWQHARSVGARIANNMGTRRIEQGNGQFGWAHHHIGTCRMGRDPRTSVVDKDLRVHGTSNLYIAGSAAFVTAGVGSPTLLLTALSLRLADHLVARVRVA